MTDHHARRLLDELRLRLDKGSRFDRSLHLTPGECRTYERAAAAAYDEVHARAYAQERDARMKLERHEPQD